MANQIVVTDNLISYNQSGAGDSAVIFLHGWRSQKEVWSGVVSRINDERLRIYSLDLPGFGGSSVPKEAWTVGGYAEIVKGFIEKLELKNVVIVGHSFGGRVGIKLAAKYPSVISKLVLVDAAGFVNQTAKKSAISIMAKIAKPFFKPKFMQGLKQRIYKTIGAEDYLATPELQKTFVNVVNEDLTEDLKKINCPTLIIFGENDNETPVEFGEKMHSLISNSRFEILPDAGHFSFLDKPEEFAKVLIDFIV
ncbi:MAG: alpha/beta hydrolase [Patescibacteria group bacterium]